MPSEEHNEGDGNQEWYIHVFISSFTYWYVFLLLRYQEGSNYIFYFSFYDGGNEKMTTGCGV